MTIYPLIQRISQLVLSKGSWLITHTRIHVTVEGLAQIPTSGPVLLVARHYHHFYDGCILLGIVPRRIHIFVALDWAQQPWVRTLMERICGLAAWPIVLRAERLKNLGKESNKPVQSAYTQAEVKRYLLRSVKESVRLLRSGAILVIFPEAYPNIDPLLNPKQGDVPFLPFREGFTKIVALAERDPTTHVAIVPTGFTYTYHKRWHVTLRFSPPLYSHDYKNEEELMRMVEQQVHTLSRPQDASALTAAERPE